MSKGEAQHLPASGQEPTFTGDVAWGQGESSWGFRAGSDGEGTLRIEGPWGRSHIKGRT